MILRSLLWRRCCNEDAYFSVFGGCLVEKLIWMILAILVCGCVDDTESFGTVAASADASSYDTSVGGADVSALAPALCVPGGCSDDNACTIDSCDAKKGCMHAPKNCSDGSAWTVDFCNNGVCKAEQLMIWFGSDIESGAAMSKPPVTYSPVVFFGEESAPGTNPFDAWTPHTLAGTVPSFYLKSFCSASNPLLNKSLFDTGYVIQESGWVTEHKFLGGHHLNVKIVTFQGLYASTLWNGEQPVLLPQSGTQEFASGMAIPQHYVSPNLKTICANLKAEQKKLE